MLRRLVVTLGIGLLLAEVFSCASTEVTAPTSTTAHSSSILLPAPADSSHEALWGFIDTSGKWVIAPQFEDAYRFDEGLAAVKLNGKWGFADKSGALVIPAKYTQADYFYDGLARVATSTASVSDPPDNSLVIPAAYGFIDKTGKMIGPAKWDQAGRFSEGLAPVMQGSKCGFIDTAGQVVVPLRFSGAATFSEGLAPVASDSGWGYIDKSGNWVIGPIYDLSVEASGVEDSAFMLGAGHFDGGIAPVGKQVRTELPGGGMREGPQFHYINQTGAQAFEGTFEKAGEFSEGLAPVEVGDPSGNSYWRFIDETGKTVIDGQAKWFVDLDTLFRRAGGFHQGLAAVQNDSGVGYIDKTGKFVVPPQFAYGGGFADGYAYVYAPYTGATTTTGEEVTWIQFGPMEIIDLTGRVIYTAPEASDGGSTTSS